MGRETEYKPIGICKLEYKIGCAHGRMGVTAIRRVWPRSVGRKTRRADRVANSSDCRAPVLSRTVRVALPLAFDNP